MTKDQFDKMCSSMPHLSPTLTSTKFILKEYTYFENKPSLFNIIKRDNYIKSNGKTCYVDTVVKRVEVDRSMITMPRNYSYYWVVRHNFVDGILKSHGCI
jgi:hypothetical protein